jgi:hypothetical protein
MVLSKQLADRAASTREVLIELLGSVGDSLATLRLRASRALVLEEPQTLGLCPRQLKVLCQILDRGRQKIGRRISDLGGLASRHRDKFHDELRLPINVEDPVAFMAEYRTCCRRLCTALNESKRVSDDVSRALLSDLGLQLEKQLWLMDASPHSRGDETCRSVSLFLTC